MDKNINASRDEILAELVEWLHGQSTERPGEDWFTVKEIMEKMPNLGAEQLRRMLDRGVRDGVIKKVNKGRSIAYYKFVKKAEGEDEYT